MSNIPFNTVASILNTGTVQRQAAATQSKRTQDEQRDTEKFKIEAARHAEQVTDLEDTTVDAIGEEPDKHNQPGKGKKRKPEDEPVREVVDTAQLSPEAAAAAQAQPHPTRKVPAVVRPSLDVSA